MRLSVLAAFLNLYIQTRCLLFRSEVKRPAKFVKSNYPPNMRRALLCFLARNAGAVYRSKKHELFLGCFILLRVFDANKGIKQLANLLRVCLAKFIP